MLSLDGAVTQHVLSHEATFEAPKADRTRLLEAVRANLSPIFCVVPDSQPLLRWMQELAQASAPMASARVTPSLLPRTPSGLTQEEVIRLWVITAPELVARFQRELALKSVLIADGHHRFSVALNNRQLCRGVMAYFACADDPALQVHPIHRVVRIAATAPATWQARLKTLHEHHHPRG